MLILLLIMVILSAIGFIVCLTCWVYTDAKKSGDEAALWALITVIVPSFFGVLVYFLVGRKNVNRTEKNIFVKPLITLGICFILFTTGFVTKVVMSTDLPVMKGVSIGMMNYSMGDKWNLSFKSSGETLNRTIKLTKEEIDKITINSSSEEGKVYLSIIQDENSLFMDISQIDNKKIDLNKFHEGKFKFYIINENAKNVKIKINWD